MQDRQLEQLEQGDCVELRGLTSAPHLNGSVCVLESWDATKARWGARELATNKLLSVAVSKLQVLSCRICWGSKMDAATGPLYAPCACRGSNAYAHLGCLKQWAVCESGLKKAGGGEDSIAAFERCPVCNQDYAGEASIELLRENVRCEEERALGTRYLNVTVRRSADADTRYGWGFGIAGVPESGAILFVHGALVTDVFDGSPAATAGIEVDDLVVSVNGRPVTPSTPRLSDLYTDHDSTVSLELGVVRRPRARSAAEQDLVLVHAELGVGGKWRGSNGVRGMDDGTMGTLADAEWISEDALCVRYANRIEQVDRQREATARLQAQRPPEESECPYVKVRVRATAYRMMDADLLEKELRAPPPGLGLARAYSVLAKQLVTDGSYGDVPEAVALGRKAVRMCEQVCDDDSAATATSRLNLASALCQQALHSAGHRAGQLTALSEAEPLALVAIRNIERRQGVDSRERNDALAAALNVLGGILNLQPTRRAEAEAVVRRQLACSEAAYGSQHLSTASCLTNLGNLISSQRSDRTSQLEARELVMRGRTVMAHLLGDSHPHLAQPTNALALIHKHLGETDEAEALLRHLVVQIGPSLGPTHPQVGSSEVQLALLLRDSGRRDEAKNWWARPGAVAFRRMGRMPEDLNDRRLS